MPASVAKPKVKGPVYRIRRILEDLKRVQETKRELTDQLKTLGVLRHEFQDGMALVLETNRQKAATLTNLGEALGEEVAKKVWKQLPERVSSYYGLIQT